MTAAVPSSPDAASSGSRSKAVALGVTALVLALLSGSVNTVLILVAIVLPVLWVFVIGAPLTALILGFSAYELARRSGDRGMRVIPIVAMAFAAIALLAIGPIYAGYYESMGVLRPY